MACHPVGPQLNQNSSQSFAKHVPLSHPGSVILSDYRRSSENAGLPFIVRAGDGPAALSQTNLQACDTVEDESVVTKNQWVWKPDGSTRTVCATHLYIIEAAIYSVENTLITSALSPITASQTGNQVVVCFHEFTSH